jgi:hypothetical protein
MFHDFISKALMSVAFRIVITPSKRIRKSEALLLLSCFALVNCAKGRERKSDNLPLVEPEQLVMYNERKLFIS